MPDESVEYVTLSVRIDADLKARVDAYLATLQASAAREGLDSPSTSTAIRSLLLAGLEARRVRSGG